MAQDTIWTITALRKWSAQYFTKAGLDTPQLDADLLLAHTLEMNKIQLILNGDQELPADKLATFKNYIIRRAREREPLQETSSALHVRTSLF